MSKKTITNSAFVFNPAAKTIDLSAIVNFDVRRLYAINNVTQSKLLYGYALAGAGYNVVAGQPASVLGLQVSTLGMLATDEISIVYDDGATDLTYGGAPLTDINRLPVELSSDAALAGVAQNATVAAITAKLGVLPAQDATSQTIATKLGVAAAQDTTVAAITAKLGTLPAQDTTVAAVTAKLGVAPAQDATVAAITAKLGTLPAQDATVALVTAKLGTLPAQDATVAAVTARLGTPAQSADVVAVVNKLGTLPAQDASLTAINTKLGVSPAQSVDIATVVTALGTVLTQKQAGSNGAGDYSANGLAVPGFAALVTIAALPARLYIEVQNQSAAVLQLVRDDGNGNNVTSILLDTKDGTTTNVPGGSWSSRTFKGRVRVFGPAGSQVSAYQD